MMVKPNKIVSFPANFARQREVREGNPGGKHRADSFHLGPLPSHRCFAAMLAGDDTEHDWSRA